VLDVYASKTAGSRRGFTGELQIWLLIPGRITQGTSEAFRKWYIPAFLYSSLLKYSITSRFWTVYRITQWFSLAVYQMVSLCHFLHSNVVIK